jgi:hypothetical protein
MRLSAPLHSEYIVSCSLGLLQHETHLGPTLTSQALLPSLTGLESRTEEHSDLLPHESLSHSTREIG